MIVILSPAKSLDFESATVTTASSDPEGAADADYLVSLLQTFSVAKLKALLGVSDKLARLDSNFRLKSGKRNSMKKSPLQVIVFVTVSITTGMRPGALKSRNRASSATMDRPTRACKPVVCYPRTLHLQTRMCVLSQGCMES